MCKSVVAAIASLRPHPDAAQGEREVIDNNKEIF
jgi:hypothetical protein